MFWKLKLSKPEMAHVAESTVRKTLREIKSNLDSQAKTGLVCWKCRNIAHKLNLPVCKESELFEFDGSKFTLEAMLMSNAHDEQFCAWALTANLNDNFCGCVRIS